MNRDQLISEIIRVVGDNAHLSDEVKEDILGNLGGFAEESLVEIIGIIAAYNKKLAADYERVYEGLIEVARDAEKAAEGERSAGDRGKIEDIKKSLGL